MAKEKGFNPVQAQHKADKAKAIKKGKASVAAARSERLAKKNPERIQKQIEELKAITQGGGKLTRHEEQLLEGLEKEIKAVRKAREELGDKAPTFGQGGGSFRDRGNHNSLGKRRRGDDNANSDDDVPADVRRIPMPRDTPPPIPKEVLDAWYTKRRAQRNANANNEPLGEGRGSGRGEGRGDSQGEGRNDQKGETAKESAPAKTRVVAPKPIVAKAVYEAKPVIRDLQKEAVTAFMPTVVRRKIEMAQGAGGLLEPEEADRLEKEGYLKSFGAGDAKSGQDGNTKPEKNDPSKAPEQRSASSAPSGAGSGSRRVIVEDVDEDEDEG